MRLRLLQDTIIECLRGVRLAVNLVPSNTVVIEVIHSTQCQLSLHDDASAITVEDVNLTNSNSSNTSNS